MDFDLSPDHEPITRLLRDFAEDEVVLVGPRPLDGGELVKAAGPDVPRQWHPRRWAR
jgi:hypothetical protein